MSSIVLPLPQPELSRYRNAHKSINNTIVFVGATFPPQVVRIMPHSIDILEYYFECKEEFFENLEFQIRKNVIYRPHLYDYGWREREIAVLKKFPEIKISNEGDIISILKGVKLCVCDHISTCFLQSLAMNTPTIAFCGTELLSVRTPAIPYFDTLMERGILFTEPKNASFQINKIWSDVSGWWDNQYIKNAVEYFSHRFCRTDENWQDVWVKELKKIVGE